MSVQWYLKGPGTWSVSLGSILTCVLLMVVYLKDKKTYTVFTLYVVLIGICGAAKTLMEQATFIQEGILFRSMPDWLIDVRAFTLTSYYWFLYETIAGMMDLLVAADCMNRYLVICRPEAKDAFLKKKITALVITVVVIVSCTFAGFVAKMETHVDAMWNQEKSLNPALYDDDSGYLWIVTIAFESIVSILLCGFHVVFTVRTYLTLKKSIAFLVQSNAGAATERILVYRKLIHFSCTILANVLLFNFALKVGEQGFVWLIHAEANMYWSSVYGNGLDRDRYGWQKTFWDELKYALKMILCLKPCCYNAAYIWLKLK